MSAAGQSVARILHIHSAANPSGLQARCIRVIGALGREAAHAIVVEGGERLVGAERLGSRARIDRPNFPPLRGKPWPGRLNKLAAAMAGFDLLLTYGAGALDAVLAHTLFADVYRLAPLVHHESGAEAEERATLFRRLALGRTAALVVTSGAAERLALGQWQQPRSRVRLIPDGIDTSAYAAAPRRDAVPGLIKRRGELWLGTLAAPHEDLRPLVRATSALPEEWQLVIGGDPAREPTIAEAERLGIDHRVHWAGAAAPATLLGLLDLFASSSSAGVLEAMAARLPIVGWREEPVQEWVASDNGPFLAAPGDEAEQASGIGRLAADPALRRRIGDANRQRAREEHDEARMVERTLALYRGLLRRG